MTNQDALGDYKTFIDTLVQDAKAAGLPLDYPSDHICFRTSTLENYDKTKADLMLISSSWLENIHHDKPIAKFVLKKPLEAAGFSIPVVELSAPGPKKYPNGLEHIELVVGDDFNSIKDRFKYLWSGIDDSGPFNQPVYITFDSGHSIKFHEKSILEVIELEGKVFSDIP